MTGNCPGLSALLVWALTQDQRSVHGLFPKNQWYVVSCLSSGLQNIYAPSKVYHCESRILTEFRWNWFRESCSSCNDEHWLDPSVPALQCSQHRLWSSRLPHQDIHWDVCVSIIIFSVGIANQTDPVIKMHIQILTWRFGKISSNRGQRTALMVTANRGAHWLLV